MGAEDDPVTSPTAKARPPVPALRILHLSGGLRAVDLNEERVWIEVTPTYRLAHFPTPPYEQVYDALDSMGFSVVGVDFLTSHAFADIHPPDWQVFRHRHGCFALAAERGWNDVKHAAHKRCDAAIVELAAKIRTYIRLLYMRIRQLSEAYNRCLNCAVSQPSPTDIGTYFDNGWITHIDAAVHAFLSDAAAFRDVLAETIWRAVLKRDDASVTRMSSFKRKAPVGEHPLVNAVLEQAQSGWIKRLGLLRDEVVHVAPVAESQEHHFAELRGMAGAEKMHVGTVHLPLLSNDGSIRKVEKLLPKHQEGESHIESMDAYMKYSKNSQDALDVCCDFFFQLVTLSVDIKDAANLPAEEIVITNADLAGPVTFY